MEHIYMCFRFKLQNTLTEYTRIISSSSKMLSKPPSSRVHSEFEWIPVNYLQFFVTLHFNTLTKHAPFSWISASNRIWLQLEAAHNKFPTVCKSVAAFDIDKHSFGQQYYFLLEEIWFLSFCLFIIATLVTLLSINSKIHFLLLGFNMLVTTMLMVCFSRSQTFSTIEFFTKFFLSNPWRHHYCKAGINLLDLHFLTCEVPLFMSSDVNWCDLKEYYRSQ